MLSPLHGVNEVQRLQMIGVIIDNLMSLVNLDDKVYSLASRLAHIARGEPI